MTLPARPEIRIAASTLVVDATAAGVVDAFAAAGVQTILLKGPSVVRALYAGPAERGYADADLLVEPRALDRAAEVLLELGFERLSEPRLALAENHAQAWKRRERPGVVDLHRTLPLIGCDPAAEWAVLSRHTESIAVGGVEMRTLDRPALALHLALHAASHGPSVEEPQRDLDLAIERFELDVWREARCVAEELDALHPLRAGLTLVDAAALADELGLPHTLPPSLALATGGPTGAAALHELVDAKGWRARFALVWRQLFPPREYMRAWSRRARRSTLALFGAYVHRWLVVAARLPRALAAVASTPQPVGAPRRSIMRKSSPVLEVSGLERRFGGDEIVRHLDFSLAPGDRLALWGPNGSGKTTVIRCIAGSLAPTSGVIAIAGHAAGSSDARYLTGLSLAQERSFYMRLSGRKNLLFFARLRYDSGRAAERAVDALAEELELAEILATRADACSAGMLQQLAFARALLGDPPLILLDEPTRSLDADAVERLWAALERRPEAAVVVASHYADDAKRCGRRIDFPT